MHPGRLAHIALLASLTALVRPRDARAQDGVSNLGDASVAPSGVVRLRATNVWIRYDERFTSSGATVPLASGFASDSFGPRQLPSLQPFETALQALTGNGATRLTLGRLEAVADSRVVVTPFALEYGVSRHLALDVVVPFVQSRTTIRSQLNPNGPNAVSANVGPNPAIYGTSNQVFNDFTTASSDLSALIQQCTSGSADSRCAAIRANPTAAQQVVQQGQTFASGVQQLYGTGTASPGAPFIPLAGSATLTAIQQNEAALNAGYQRFLGRAATAQTLGGATGPGANDLVGALLASPDFAGVDSVGGTERLWVGDVQVGASWQLVDQLRDSVARRAPGLHWRAALHAAALLPTGKPARGLQLFEVGTGTGQAGVDGRAAVDLRFGSLVLASIAGRYAKWFGDARVYGAPNPDGAIFPLTLRLPVDRQIGAVMQLDATPRFFLTPYLTLNGYYSLRHRGDDRYTLAVPASSSSVPVYGAPAPVTTIPGVTEQRAGLGFGYSAAQGGVRRGTLPIDVTFAHLETVSARGGPAVKAFYDQIQVRIYYRLFGQ